MDFLMKVTYERKKAFNIEGFSIIFKFVA